MMLVHAPIDVDWLAQKHLELRLVLQGPDGGVIVVTVENVVDESPAPTIEDAHAYVTELIRLARLGAAVEAQGNRS